MSCGPTCRFTLTLLLVLGMQSTSLQAQYGDNSSSQSSLPPELAPVFASSTLQQPYGGGDDSGFVPPMSPLGSIFEGFEEQEGVFTNKPGANANERPLWGPAHFKVIDPDEFPMITSLRNEDPNSFWYSKRSNLFNIRVDDEWDWSNLINTDRSDFTDTPFTVGTGTTYLESGYTYTKVNSAGGDYSLRTLPETLLRHGVSEDFELRIKWIGYNMIDVKDPSSGIMASSSGTSDLDLGFKWQVFPQKNWFPKTTIVPGILVPTGTNGFSGNSVQPHFNIVNGWGIRRYIYLKHQFGMDYLTQPNFMVSGSVNGPMGPTGPFLNATHPTVDSFHNSISCLYQATKHVGGFVEWYILYGNLPTTNYADTGFFFYLTPNVQLDTTFGSSIDSPSSTVLFVKGGFSTRW